MEKNLILIPIFIWQTPNDSGGVNSTVCTIFGRFSFRHTLGSCDPCFVFIYVYYTKIAKLSSFICYQHLFTFTYDNESLGIYACDKKGSTMSYHVFIIRSSTSIHKK